MLAFPLELVRVAIGFLITRLILAFGFGAVSWVAVSSAIDWIEAEIHSVLSSTLPDLMLNLMGLLRVDLCVNLIFSALTGVIAFRAMAIMIGRK